MKKNFMNRAEVILLNIVASHTCTEEFYSSEQNFTETSF